MSTDVVSKIQFKRTTSNYSDVQNTTVDFGEPIFINDNYLIVGQNSDSGTTVANSKVIKAVSKTLADSTPYYETTTGTLHKLKDESGNSLYIDQGQVKDTNGRSVEGMIAYETGIRLGQASYAAASSSAGGSATYVHTTKPTTGTLCVAGVSSDSTTALKYNTDITINVDTGVLMGAAWNDFAENRKCMAEPGAVVCETGDGSLRISTDRLQTGAAVVSDTYGMLIGDIGPDYRPIAVAGRVLVRFAGDKSTLEPGDALCAGPIGCAVKMTRKEIRRFPDRILGYVSEIPTYTEWNGIPVENRVWIKVV